PVGPGAGETVEDLTRIGLRTITLVLGKLGERLLIGHRTPEERRDVVLLDLLQPCRDTGLAEILLRENVGRDLAELRRDVDVLEPEHDGTVGVLDFAGRLAELDIRVCRLACLGEATFDAHLFSPYGP